MYVYQCIPIDSGWDDLPTVEAVAKTIGAREAAYRARTTKGHLYEFGDDGVALQDFLEGWDEAKSAAGARGWEGDFRGDPCVFWLPNETGFDYAFVFKQDNNGTTFIVSPRPLPWVEEFGELMP